MSTPVITASAGRCRTPGAPRGQLKRTPHPPEHRRQTQRATPIWRIFLALLTLLATAQASAQDDIVFLPTFGFEQRLVGDSWCPVTLWVSSADRAVDGVATVSYAQSADQNAIIRAPFATTPGKTTPVEMLVCIPQHCTEVAITLSPRDGRSRTMRYVYNPSPGEGKLPWLLAPQTLAVQIGESSFATISAGDDERPIQIEDEDPMQAMRAQSLRAGNRLPDDHELWLDYLTVSRIRPGALPRSWAAYDGLLAVVAGGDDALEADPLDIDQLHRWVRAGGRLVVQVGSGDDWRRWLPSEARDFVVAPAPSSIATPQALRHVLGEGAVALDLDLPAIAARVTARPLTLAPRARAWSTRWPVPETEGAGLIAEGPVGFGWVTVLGVDPKRATDIVSNAAAGILWRDAMANVAADHRKRIAQDLFNYTYARGDTSMISALSHLADMPPVGDGAFFLIIAGIAVMGLLIGPGDAFVLKRLRQRHRSWITALLWIGLASLLAYAAPAIVRSGETRVNTLEVVDLLPPESRVAAPGYSTLLTGVFASRSGRMEFARPSESAFWRGVSPLYGYEVQSGLSWFLATTQRARRDDAGWPRGNPLEDLRTGIWTFRTFQSHGPTTGALADLEVELALGDWPRLIVRNLPEGAQVVDSAACTHRGWYEFAAPEPTPDGLSLDARTNYASPRAPVQWADEQEEADFYYWNHRTPALTGQVAFKLDGPAGRADAAERSVQSRDFACVFLRIRGLPPPFELATEPSIGSHAAFVRALVPITQADDPRADPAPVRPQQFSPTQADPP